jgi:hypothetical protein
MAIDVKEYSKLTGLNETAAAKSIARGDAFAAWRIPGGAAYVESKDEMEDILEYCLKSITPRNMLAICNLIERAYKQNDLTLYNDFRTKYDEQCNLINDCVYDPAYIKHCYPDWYKSLYGDLSPEEAIHAPGGCVEQMENDPDEKYGCYDDEDK